MIPLHGSFKIICLQLSFYYALDNTANNLTETCFRLRKNKNFRHQVYDNYIFVCNAVTNE